MYSFEYDDDKEYFSILGDIDQLFENREIKSFFKTFSIINQNQNEIEFFVASTDLVRDFNEIESFFLSKNIQFTVNESADSTISRLIKEKEDFEIKSAKAKEIYWGNIPSREMKEFTEHLKESFVNRRLDSLQTLSSFHLAFSKNGCNFSVPGSGKTTTVLASFSYLQSKGDLEKILVVGPKACFQPWEDEFFLCFGKRPKSVRIETLSKQKKKTFFKSIGKEDLTLMHFQSLANNQEDIITYLKNNKCMVVIDEAHWIKNTDDGVWANAALEIAPFCSSRVILTGTPAPNGFIDLTNLFEFIWPKRNLIPFGTATLSNLSELEDNDFQNKLREKKINQLVDALKPFFVRVRKKDLKLPDPIYHPPLMIEMGPLQREIYDFIESRYIEKAKQLIKEDEPVDVLLKAKTIRLRQAATNPSLLNSALEKDSYHEENNSIPDIGENLTFIEEPEIFKKIKEYTSNEVPNKFKQAKKLVKDILNRGEKVIIWVNFIKNIHELSAYLEDAGYQNKFIYGEIPSGNISSYEFEIDFDTRESIIEDFKQKNSPFSVLIANPATMGESVSLHRACNNAIYLERDYNAASFLQSKDRIHRKGLEKDAMVNYYFLESENSIDKAISKRLELKVKNLEDIIEHPIPLFSLNEELSINDIKSILEEYASR